MVEYPTLKCSECGAESEFIAGATNIAGERMEQFHCPKCHHTVVVLRGKAIKGYIAEQYIQNDWGYDVVYYIERD